MQPRAGCAASINPPQSTGCAARNIDFASAVKKSWPGRGSSPALSWNSALARTVAGRNETG